MNCNISTRPRLAKNQQTLFLQLSGNYFVSLSRVDVSNDWWVVGRWVEIQTYFLSHSRNNFTNGNHRPIARKSRNIILCHSPHPPELCLRLKNFFSRTSRYSTKKSFFPWLITTFVIKYHFALLRKFDFCQLITAVECLLSSVDKGVSLITLFLLFCLV